MAKVTAPLLSLDARGKFGDTLIYSKCLGTSYTKAYAVPKNPRSTGQTAQRLMVKIITQLWSTLTAEQKSTWAPLALELQLSPYHAFLRFNTREWNDFRPPSPIFVSSRNSHDCVSINDIWPEEETMEISAFSDFGVSQPWLSLFFLVYPPSITPQRTDLQSVHMNWVFYDPDYSLVFSIPNPTPFPDRVFLLTSFWDGSYSPAAEATVNF